MKQLDVDGKGTLTDVSCISCFVLGGFLFWVVFSCLFGGDPCFVWSFRLFFAGIPVLGGLNGNPKARPLAHPRKAPRRPRMKKHARIGCRSPDASEALRVASRRVRRCVGELDAWGSRVFKPP